MAEFRINTIIDTGRGRRQLGQLQRRMGATASTAQRLRGILAGLFAFSAISVGLFGTIRTLRDFSQELSTVQAITGATAAEFEHLRVESQRLGATTRFTASQAAEGMVFLARAGFDVASVLSATEGSLRLAQAGALSLGRAADISSNILIGFGLEVEEISRVVDVLALASNRSNTNVEQLGQAMKFVAPVAAGLRLEVEETTAALGVLADAGLQASIGGTGLRRVLAELESPTRRTGNILTNLGVETSEVRVSQVGLAAALDRLGEAGVNAGIALQLFGDRGGPAFEVLANGVPRLRQLTEALGSAEGSAEEMARIMDENLNGAMLAVASASEALVIEFGRASGLTDSLTQSARGLATFIRTLVANVDTVIDVVQTFGVVLGVYLAGQAIPLATRGLVALTAAITSNSVAALFASFTAFPALIAATKAFTLALSTNPLGIFLIALSAGIALLIGFGNRIDLTSDGMITLRDAVGAAFSGLGRAASSLLSVFGSILQALAPVIQIVAQLLTIFIRLSGILQILEVIAQALAIAARVLSVAMALIAPVIEVIITPIQYLLELITSLIGAFDGLSDRTRQFAEERRSEQAQLQNLLQTPVLPTDTATPLVRPDSGLSIEDVRGTPASSLEEEITLLRNEADALQVNRREREALERIQQIEVNTLQELTAAERKLVDIELERIQVARDDETLSTRIRELEQEASLVGRSAAESARLQERYEIETQLLRDLTYWEAIRLDSLVRTNQQLNAQDAFNTRVEALEREGQLLQLSTADAEVHSAVREAEIEQLRELDFWQQRRLENAVRANQELRNSQGIQEQLQTLEDNVAALRLSSVEQDRLRAIQSVSAQSTRELTEAERERAIALSDISTELSNQTAVAEAGAGLGQEILLLRETGRAYQELQFIQQVQSRLTRALTEQENEFLVTLLRQKDALSDTRAFDDRIAALREQHDLLILTGSELSLRQEQYALEAQLQRSLTAAEIDRLGVLTDSIEAQRQANALESNEASLNNEIRLLRQSGEARERLASQLRTEAQIKRELTIAEREEHDARFNTIRLLEAQDTFRDRTDQLDREIQILQASGFQRRVLQAQLDLEIQTGRRLTASLREQLAARLAIIEVLESIDTFQNTIDALDREIRVLREEEALRGRLGAQLQTEARLRRGLTDDELRQFNQRQDTLDQLRNDDAFGNILEDLRQNVELAQIASDGYERLSQSINGGVATGNQLAEVLSQTNDELDIQRQILQLETQVLGGFTDTQRESVRQYLELEKAIMRYNDALAGSQRIIQETEQLELFDRRAAEQLSLLQRFNLDGPVESLSEAQRAVRNLLLAVDNLRFSLQQQNEAFQEIRGPQEDLIRQQEALNILYESGRINIDEYTSAIRRNGIAQIEATAERGEGGFLEGFILAFDSILSEARNFRVQFGEIIGGALTDFVDGVSNSIGQAVVGMQSFSEALRDVGRQIVSQLVSALVRLVAQFIIMRIVGGTLQKIALASTVATAAAAAAAWAPAAALASLATVGANAGPAAAALASTAAISFGIAGSSAAVGTGASAAAPATGTLTAADGGFISGPGGPRSDMISARLSDGEYVVNAAATRRNRDLLDAINSGQNVSRGDTINNVTVNVQTPDADSFNQHSGQIYNDLNRQLRRAQYRE